jgi:hypothetical protein
VLDNLLILMASVMHLIKMWLTNQNVIIANDVLSEMHIFADGVIGSDLLSDLALEVLECIPDKVQFLLVIVDEAPLNQAIVGLAELSVLFHHISLWCEVERKTDCKSASCCTGNFGEGKISTHPDS